MHGCIARQRWQLYIFDAHCNSLFSNVFGGSMAGVIAGTKRTLASSREFLLSMAGVSGLAWAWRGSAFVTGIPKQLKKAKRLLAA